MLPRSARPTRWSRLVSSPFISLASVSLALAACGGGGSGGAGASGPTFVAPTTAVSTAIGGTFPVHLTGFAPGALVVIQLDADGDRTTTGDLYTIDLPVTTSASGEIDRLISTDVGTGVAPGVPTAGHYALFAAAVSGGDVAKASAGVDLVASTLTRLLEGSVQERMKTVAVLSGGRIAVGGDFYDSVTHETAEGPLTLDANDDYDGLVALFEGDGTLATMWPIAGAGSEYLADMTADIDGGFTVAGWYANGLTSVAGANPGNAQTSAPNDDASEAFGASYSSSGSLQSAVFTKVAPAMTLDADHWFSAIATASDGDRWHILVGTGWVQIKQDMLFNLGDSGVELVRSHATDGSFDGFLAVSGIADANGLAVLDGGDVLICGSSTGEVTFAPGRPGQTTLSSDDQTMFVARFHPDGSLVAIFRLPTLAKSSADRLAALPDGRCFVVGEVSGVATFGPGMSDDATGHETDGFVASFDAALAPRWAQFWITQGNPLVAASASVYVDSVVALADGSCVVAGTTRYWTTADDFGVGSGTGIDYDALIARYDAKGDVQWGISISGPSDQLINDLAVDQNGAIIAVGSTVGPTVLIDRSDATTLLLPTSVDSVAGLLLRIDPDGRLR